MPAKKKKKIQVESSSESDISESEASSSSESESDTYETPKKKSKTKKSPKKKTPTKKGKNNNNDSDAREEEEEKDIITTEKGANDDDSGAVRYFGHNGKYACLSNMCTCYPFDLDGKKWKTIEHYYQASKFMVGPSQAHAETIFKAKTPVQASKLGRSTDFHVRDDWDKVKYDQVVKAMKAKFEQNPKAAKMLVTTHPREILFGTDKNKNDLFWGHAKGNGENKMGKALMDIRSSLKDNMPEKMDTEDSNENEKDGDKVFTELSDLHKIENAKTGRAKCKECREPLEKGILRVGRKFVVRGNEVVLWCCKNCFFERYIITEDISEWKGFKTLSAKDQEDVLKHQAKDENNKKKDKQVLVKEFIRFVSAEYATSNRSSCKWCKNTINKNELRLANVVKSAKFDGRMAVWHHKKCFFERYEIPNADSIDNLSALRWEDQQVVTNLANTQEGIKIKPKDKKPEDKKTIITTTTTTTMRRRRRQMIKKNRRVNVSSLSSYRADKNKKKADDEDEDSDAEKDDPMETDEAKAENKKFWEIKDQLKVHCSKQDLKDMLEENEQLSTGGVPQLIERCTYGMLFGALPKCTTCGGKLEYGKRGYFCKGYLSAWTKCTFRGADVEHLDQWKIPEKLADKVAFLSEFEFKKNERVKMLTSPVKESPKKRKLDEAEVEDEKESPTKQKKQKTKKTPEKEKKGKLVVKGRSAVHPESGLEKMAHILHDAVKDLYYNTTLNMSDLITDTNAYYIIQILELDATNNNNDKPYVLFKKWGRVGTTRGSKSLVKYEDKDAAIKDFLILFEEKTGNSWENRGNVEKKAGKYVPIDIDYGGDNLGEAVDLKSNEKSKLPKQLQNLISLLFDVEIMQKTLFELEFDVERMPLGILTKSQIQKGYQALSKISDLLDKGVSEDSYEYKDFSNQFFTVIPHKFRERGHHIINSRDALQDKIDMLDALQQISIAHSMLKKGDDEEDPLEAHYKKLNTNLDPVKEDDEEFAFIQKYFENTQDTKGRYTLEVLDVFRVAVDRNGEKERYLPNRRLAKPKLLFHGSRVTNFVGILSQGLKIAPPDVPASGYLFGKGLYFADMIAKSAHYCRTTPENNVGLVLLSEVALGQPFKVNAPQFMEKPPKGYQSTLGVGQVIPDPNTSLNRDDFEVPLGKAINNKVKTSNLYNEYIVYQEDQVYNRYLVKVKFHYK